MSIAFASVVVLTAKSTTAVVRMRTAGAGLARPPDDEPPHGWASSADGETVTSFIEALYEPERHCTCGHHEGSHCHGFSNQACMWCDCRAFEDPARTTPAVARESLRPRHFFAGR